MDTSDSVLNGIVASPNDDAWRRFNDLYRPLLRAWIARAGVPASDADDLAQEVLFVVSRKVAGFERRGPGAFRAWLRAILANELRDYFCGQKNRPIATGGSDFQSWLEQLKSHDSALSRLLDREHDDHVVASLLRRVQGDFAPATWQAFLRYVQEGELAVKVAQALGPSLNSVVLAKSRVHKRLRQEAAGLVE
jgi:RNA polymerase sigma-70 factor (ECF subfamily)